MPFTRSSEISIRTHAIFILSHLVTLLSSQPANLIHPCPHIMNSLLMTFEHASTANNHSACLSGTTRVMTASEISNILENLLLNEENCTVIIERDIIPTLASLLATGRIEEQKSACRLMWSLLHHSGFKEQVSSSELPLVEMVQMLDNASEKELKQLSMYTRFAFEGISEEGKRYKYNIIKYINWVSRRRLRSHTTFVCILMNYILRLNIANGYNFVCLHAEPSLCLEFARGCYTYGYHLECEELCKRLEKQHVTEHERNQASILLGKANFHLYQRERYELKQAKELQQQHTAEYQVKHTKCYNKAKIVIALLGTALDKGLIDNEEEELRMLDVAMMDLLQETNKLDRCLLCQRKTRLLKSHYFPRCLLKDFCSGLESADDQRVLVPTYNPQCVPKSPKEVVFFMFCRDCEQFLSKHGENQFRTEFFSRIYDPTNPLQRTAEQCIEYDEWLYEFCLGIILRGLAVYHRDYFFNGDKIHELFQTCRKFLLSPKSTCQKNLTIALIMSPLEKSLGRDELDIPSRVTVHAFVQYLHLFYGLDGVRQFGPLWFHSFVVHFAEINIVAVVNEKDVQHIPEKCLITRKKGIYIVPDEKTRQHTTPRGIIKGIQQVAKSITEFQLQLGSRFLEEFEKKKQAHKVHAVPNHLKETFLIAPFSKDTSADHTPNLEEPLKTPLPLLVDVLPEQFVVRPPSINLPQGHRILIHENLSSSNDTGNLLFIAIGNCASYSLDRPYVIHHHYEPNVVINMGYFISPSDCSVQEFLLDKFPKEALKDAAKSKFMKHVQSQLPQLLPQVVQARGFINFLSLLKRATHSPR